MNGLLQTLLQTLVFVLYLKNIRTLDLSKVTPSTFELFSKVPFCAVLDRFQARPKCHSLEFSPLPAPGVVNLMADFFLLVLELNEFLVSEKKRQNEALIVWVFDYFGFGYLGRSLHKIIQ